MINERSKLVSVNFKMIGRFNIIETPLEEKFREATWP